MEWCHLGFLRVAQSQIVRQTHKWGLCYSSLHLGAALLLLLFSLSSTQQVCIVGMQEFRNGLNGALLPTMLKMNN